MRLQQEERIRRSINEVSHLLSPQDLRSVLNISEEIRKEINTVKKIKGRDLTDAELEILAEFTTRSIEKLAESATKAKEQEPNLFQKAVRFFDKFRLWVEEQFGKNS